MFAHHAMDGNSECRCHAHVISGAKPLLDARTFPRSIPRDSSTFFVSHSTSHHSANNISLYLCGSMADNENDADIQAQIAALAGRINRRKQQEQQQQTYQYRGGGSRGGYRGSNRYMPYGAYGRGRGGYPGYQNRSAVFSAPATPTTPGSGAGNGYGSDAGSTVSGTIDAQPVAVAAAAGVRLVPQPPQTPRTVSRNIMIEGITFRMKEDGSKLTRVSGITPSPLKSPSSLY